MRPSSKQQQMYLHSNSVGTFSSQQQHYENNQHLFSSGINNNSGLSNKPIGKSSSLGSVVSNQKHNSPNTSHDSISPLLLAKNRTTVIPKAIDKEISKWSCQDVGVWLDWKKLSHLKQIFIQNQISGDELLELTDAEMINDLKVREESERKIIKDLIENREMWMKKLSNDSLDSLEESYPKQVSPTIGGMMNNNIGRDRNSKPTQFTNSKSYLELDEFSDCDDLTSVGGVFLDRSTIGSQKLEIVLETLYKDFDSVKFKVYRGNDIYVITQKRSQLSFTSLKLEIIERYQCLKPSILYKVGRDGENIKINRDEDLARVISTYHHNGGDVSQPIKLQIEMNDVPVGLFASNSSSNTCINQSVGGGGSMQSPRTEWSSASDQSQTSSNSLLPPNNQLAQKLIEMELDNIEKNNTIRELEIRLHNQQIENEKQITCFKSLQDDISNLKMQIYSYKHGTVFNPSGSLSKQEEVNEYIKLCRSLQVSLSTAQNKLFELIGNQL